MRFVCGICSAGDRTVLAAMLLIVMPVDAGAQSPPGLAPHTGSLVPSKSRPDGSSVMAEGRALTLARKSSACAVRKDPKGALEVLRAATADDYDKSFRDFVKAFSQCASLYVDRDASITKLYFDRLARYSLIAEAWLKRDGGGTPSGGADDLKPVKFDWLLDTEGWSVLLNLTDCLNRTQPFKSRALIVSEPGSSSEVAAFQQIMPDLKSCIGDREGVRTSRNGMRLTLAAVMARREVQMLVNAPTALKAN